MSTVIIFIPAWVLRKSVLDWAACLRTDDHLVHAPDLFDGAVFDDLKAGAAACNAIGIPALLSVPKKESAPCRPIAFSWVFHVRRACAGFGSAASASSGGRPSARCISAFRLRRGPLTAQCSGSDSCRHR
jgi:hypothetical protein